VEGRGRFTAGIRMFRPVLQPARPPAQAGGLARSGVENMRAGECQVRRQQREVRKAGRLRNRKKEEEGSAKVVIRRPAQFAEVFIQVCHRASPRMPESFCSSRLSLPPRAREGLPACLLPFPRSLPAPGGSEGASAVKEGNCSLARQQAGSSKQQEGRMW